MMALQASSNYARTITARRIPRNESLYNPRVLNFKVETAYLVYVQDIVVVNLFWYDC